MKHGWFKMDREIFDDKLLCRDTEYLAVWCWLCAHAAFKERSVVFAGKPVTLQPGQLITGRNVIAKDTGVSASKTERILTKLESGQRIEQQKCSKNRLISILDVPCDEKSEQEIGQQANNKRTATGQQANTIKNDKNDYNKYGNTYARAGARNAGWKKTKESVYSSDASYDLEAYMQQGLEKLLNYQPKEQ